MKSLSSCRPFVVSAVNNTKVNQTINIIRTLFAIVSDSFLRCSQWRLFVFLRRRRWKWLPRINKEEALKIIAAKFEMEHGLYRMGKRTGKILNIENFCFKMIAD